MLEPVYALTDIVKSGAGEDTKPTFVSSPDSLVE
jgi:hypothetical protein